MDNINYLDKPMLFIWIPKTAGTSITKLFNIKSYIYRSANDEIHYCNNNDNITFGHANIYNILKKNIISQKEYNNYYKFTVVRNPYDRVVSLYHYRKLYEKYTFKEWVFFLYKNRTNIAPLSHVNVNPSPLSYLKDSHNMNELLVINNTQIESIWNPMYKWIPQDIDKIFFFEKISRLQDIYRESSELDESKFRLPKLNSRNYGNYYDYYDNDTQKIIYDLYKEDFIMFNYSYKINTVSKINLELLEKKYGGFTKNIPINKISIYDPNADKIDGLFYTGCENKITKLQCGGDRMSSSQMAYGDVYEKVIETLTNVISIIEIGILTGIGLAIWSDIFPKADIYGLDIDLSHFNNNKPKLINKGAFKNNNVDVYEFDQYKPNVNLFHKLTTSNKFNFIIDDGCHEDTAIIKTFTTIFPFLHKNFIYIIEDNSNAYKELLKLYDDIHITNIEQISIITMKNNTTIHKSLESITSLNSTKHAVYFTDKKQIVSHSTNNSYGNKLLAKYNIGDTIKLNKGVKTLTLKLVKKTVKGEKVVLYFDNEIDEELLENRRNWTIL